MGGSTEATGITLARCFFVLKYMTLPLIRYRGLTFSRPPLGKQLFCPAEAGKAIAPPQPIRDLKDQRKAPRKAGSKEEKLSPEGNSQPKGRADKVRPPAEPWPEGAPRAPPEPGSGISKANKETLR